MPLDALTPRQTICDLVQELPESSSYDEILEELVMNHMVTRGLSDSAAGRTSTDEEMAATIDSWH